jgi:hypothetical protein
MPVFDEKRRMILVVLAMDPCRCYGLFSSFHRDKEVSMQARTVVWGGRCLVVMLRPSGKSDERKHTLEAVLEDSASNQNVPRTLYKWMRVSSGEENFSAWNIGHEGLLLDLLRRRNEGSVSFSAYYRFCGGVSVVVPEEGLFEGS